MKKTDVKIKSLLKKSPVNLLLFVVLILLASQFAVAQTVYTVDNRPESGAQFTSVNTAIQAAAAGDIIYIHPSPTSYGNIDIDKTIKLVGPGHDPANSGGLRATLGTVTLRANSLQTVITGLNAGTITAYSFGSNTAGVHIINNRLTNGVDGYYNGTDSEGWIIEGNYFETAYNTINIDANGSDNWNVRNNFFSGTVNGFDRTTIFTNNLFFSDDPSGTTTIFQNSNDITSPIVTNNMFIFTDPDVTGLVNSGSTPITYTNCLTYKTAGGAALPALPGTGNLDNTDPLFTDITSGVSSFYNNDYTLGSGSPAIGASTDLGDIGIFGRNFPFDIHGRPHSMPYPESMTILNTVVQPGQDLNVEFQASQKN